MWHGHAREIPLLVGRVKEPEDTRGIQATLRSLREKKAKANNTRALSQREIRPRANRRCNPADKVRAGISASHFTRGEMRRVRADEEMRRNKCGGKGEKKKEKKKKCQRRTHEKRKDLMESPGEMCERDLRCGAQFATLAQPEI